MAGADTIYAQQSAGSYISNYRKSVGIGISHPTPAILRYAVRRIVANQRLRRDALLDIRLCSIISIIARCYIGIN